MTIARAASIALAGIIFLLAGCTNDPGPAPTITDPRGTGSATPKEELTPDPQTAAEREAIQAFKDYNTSYDETGQNCFKDWESKVPPHTTDAYQDEVLSYLGLWSQSGFCQIGGTSLSAFKIVGHEEPGFGYTDHKVTFEVCTDTTGADVLKPDGTSALETGSTGRRIATIEMWHTYLAAGEVLDADGQPVSEKSYWQVARFDVDRGRPCD